MSRIVLALACASLAPIASASDEITFTFDDPAAGGEFQGNAGMPGSLTYDTAAVLDLVVDTSDQPLGGINVFSANLEMNLTVGAPAAFGGIISAPVDGSFTFTDMLSGEVIFTATTTNARLVNFDTAGSVISSVDGSGTGLTFTAGPALVGIGVEELMALDAVFTLTDINVEEAAAIFSNIGGSDAQLNNFDANAAFTATATGQVVPAPGAIALAGLGLIGAARRRRA
ncbi:MAG: PEP-CTERM sorting domain-containing protein [Planctomycetota bacterium]